ncbi:MAG TPA: hypothetical protein VGH11_13480 [Jatrophihabitans sp.]
MRKKSVISPELTELLRNETVAYKDAQELYHVHRDRWQDAITTAVDEGASLAVVAELAHVSQARVHAIVTRITAKAA